MFTLSLQSLPDPPSSPHTQLIFLYKAIKSNLCCSQTLGYAVFFTRMWFTPLEISSCSSYQLPIAPQLGVRLHVCLPSPCLDLSGFSFRTSVSAVTTTVSSDGQLSCSVQKQLPFDHPLPLDFDALSAPSFTVLPEGRCSRDIPFKDEHSSILYVFSTP